MSLVERARFRPSVGFSLKVGAVLAEMLALSVPAKAMADSEIGLNPKGDTQLTVSVDQYRATVIRAQDIDIAGNHYSVNPSENPGATMVIGISADRGVNIPASVTGGQAVGIRISDINAGSNDQRVSELDRVTREQALRSLNPNECGQENGCTFVRMIEFVANEDGTFNLVTDGFIGEAPQVQVPQLEIQKPKPVPKYPENMDGAASTFGAKAGDWKKNTIGAWNYNSSNGEQDVTPGGFIMEGYNKDGVFVAFGNVHIKALGVTIWPVSGQAEVDTLVAVVKKNNPGKSVRVVGD